MNKQSPITPIKPLTDAVEVLPSFTDTLRNLEYLSCSGLLKGQKVWKLKKDVFNREELDDLLKKLSGKAVYIAFFDDPLFKSLDDGLGMIKSIQDVDWAS